jgi:hypothetical protein
MYEQMHASESMQQQKGLENMLLDAPNHGATPDG